MRKSIIIIACLFLFIACATPPRSPTRVDARETVFPSSTAIPPTPIATQSIPTLTNPPTTIPTLPASSATAPRVEIKAPTIVGRLRLRELNGAGRRPTALARIGPRLFVVNMESNNVAVIVNDDVTGFIPVGAGPNALTVDAERERVYVASYNAKQIALIAGLRVAITQDLHDQPNVLAFHDGLLYVGLANNPEILVLDGTTLQERAAIYVSHGFGIYGFALDGAHNLLYASAYGRVFVIDLATRRQMRSFTVENIYQSLTVNPVTGAPWLGAYDSQARKEFIGEYDREAGTPLARVEAGGDLRQALFDSAGARLYLASAFDNRIDVIDALNKTRVAMIPTGLRPTALALDEKSKRLYVANNDSDSVNVIDLATNQVRTTIPLAMSVQSLASNETKGRVYVANSSSDSVFIIENGRVAREVPVGRHPHALARDDRTNTLYVANQADGTLTTIDENTLIVRSSTFITRVLTALDVDSTNRRLFADSTVFEIDPLRPLNNFIARGITLLSSSGAFDVRVNTANGKFYVSAWNGIPGSNSRTTLYAFSERDPNFQRMISPLNGGNVTAYGIDPNTNRLLAASTHPLGYTSALDLWNENDELVQTLALSSRTRGLTINPRTQHIFLSHSGTFEPFPGALKKRDDTVQILDTRTLGEIAWLDVPGAPGPSTRLGDTIYVAGLDDGAVTLIADLQLPAPPAPTPTFTPTPFLTLTPAPRPSPTLTRVPTASPQAVATPACSHKLGTLANAIWVGEVAARLGCAVADERQIDAALMRFANGFLLDDLEFDGKWILVIYDDHKYSSFRDTWDEGQPSDSCPAIAPLANSVKPQRGFGKVWCEQIAVRVKLGSAPNPESLVRATRQQFQRGTIYRSDEVGVFIVLDDGTWR